MDEYNLKDELLGAFYRTHLLAPLSLLQMVGMQVVHASPVRATQQALKFLL